jgi:hypothetical protein
MEHPYKISYTNLNKAYVVIKMLKETMSYKIIRSMYYLYLGSSEREHKGLSDTRKK